MTAFVLTGAIDLDGEGYWNPGGGAASLLDGIDAADDGLHASFAALDNTDHILTVKIAPPAGLPGAIDVSLRHQRTSGFAQLLQLWVEDAAGQAVYAAWLSHLLPSGAYVTETFSLDNVYGGSVNVSADWSVKIRYYAPTISATALLDLVAGEYDGAGGGIGGTGPGGQVGQNASILIPTMVQP